MEEPEEIDQEGIDEKARTKASKFQSPVPILKKLHNLIFGRRIPDVYTQITFYMNTVIWTTFMVWNVISYFALSTRELIEQEKGIPISEIIRERGTALGFSGDNFLNRLLTFHSVSMICWAVVFVGLILLYRKSHRSIYFVLGGIIFYLGMMIFYISYRYFVEDTTAYDKVALLIIVVSTLLHFFLMRNERNGGSTGFFGEPTEEVE